MSANRGLPEGMGLGHPAILLGTWFGAGLVPGAPGTMGSLAALPFAWVIHQAFGWSALAAAAVALFAAGVWSAGVIVRTGGAEDPSAIVVDEVVGQWLVLLAVQPDLVLYAAGFVLFRIFDIWKPWPVSWADANIKGGLGVMVDDVLAAAYAAAVLYAAAQWM